MTFTNSTVSASYSVRANQRIDRKSSTERSCRLGQSSKKIEAAITQCHFTLFADFKRESTQDSDQ